MEFRGLRLLGVILLGLVCVALAADKEIKGPKGISVKVLGKSGKISLIRNINVTKGNETKVRRNIITLEMDAIKEKDKDENEVGSSKKDKHSFNGFAKLDFMFSDVMRTKFQNLNVQQFNFSAKSIGGTGGNLMVMIYLFEEGGEIETGKNESEEVSKGSFKFSIKITDWTFCGGEECKKGQTREVGALIDFTISIKSKGGKRGSGKKCPRGRGCGKNFEFGEANATCSKQIKVDGNWTDMDDDYPKLEIQGSKKMLVFRFPKFTKEVFYDPTFTMGDEAIDGSGEEPTDKATSTPTSGAQKIGVPIALFILAVLSAIFHY